LPFIRPGRGLASPLEAFPIPDSMSSLFCRLPFLSLALGLAGVVGRLPAFSSLPLPQKDIERLPTMLAAAQQDV
jgi:hypothetical protein